MPILTTRLYKPPVGERFILRERLIERLKNEADRPVTLVVGGARYGKKHFFQWIASFGQGWGSQIVATVGTGSSAILTP